MKSESFKDAQEMSCHQHHSLEQITHAPCFHGPVSLTAKDLDASALETAGRVGLCARTTALQRNYLVENLGPATACSLLIKGSSCDRILSCSLSTSRFENPSALQ